MKPLLVALCGAAGLLLIAASIALIVALIESREFDWADEDD